jgi:hypothetical protein
MGKTLALVAGMVALMASAAGADACGIREGGCLPGTYTGKLIQKRVRVGPGCITPYVNNHNKDIWIGPMPRPLFVTHWMLETAGGSLRLDLGDNKALHKQAAELLNKQVIVTGMSRDGRISVFTLKADDTVIRKGKLIREVEFRDNPVLPREPGMIYCPIGIRLVVKWYVEVDGTRHELSLSPELQKKAQALIGKTVTVTGKLSGRVLTVSALEAAAR